MHSVMHTHSFYSPCRNVVPHVFVTVYSMLYTFQLCTCKITRHSWHFGFGIKGMGECLNIWLRCKCWIVCHLFQQLLHRISKSCIYNCRYVGGISFTARIFVEVLKSFLHQLSIPPSFMNWYRLCDGEIHKVGYFLSKSNWISCYSFDEGFIIATCTE